MFAEHKNFCYSHGTMAGFAVALTQAGASKTQMERRRRKAFYMASECMLSELATRKKGYEGERTRKMVRY
jgi:hypothetical protein